MLSILAAWPPGPSAAAFRPDGHHAPTWSALPNCAGPRHAAPEGAFPQPPAARLPRASRPLRAAVARNPARRNTEALFRSLRLAAQILRENQAAKPRPDESQARPSYVGPGPQSCAASPGPLWRLKGKKNGQPAVSLFRSTRRDFTYAVQGLLAPASLRSTLSRCGVISLGSSKKYSGGYEAFLARWAKSASSSVAITRCCW